MSEDSGESAVVFPAFSPLFPLLWLLMLLMLLLLLLLLMLLLLELFALGGEDAVLRSDSKSTSLKRKEMRFV